MEKNYTHIFAKNMDIDPPSDLSIRINNRITQARVRHDHNKAYIHSSITLLTLVALIPLVQYTSIQAVQSGFTGYASLILTDGIYLIDSWKELILSIIESIPIISTALTLGVILISVNSLRKSLSIISTNNWTSSWIYKN